MKDKFDLIIFDWDGTLINSIDWIVSCVQQAAKNCRCSVPSEQAVKDIIGLSLNNALKQLFPHDSANTRQQIQTHYSELFVSKDISREDLFSGIYNMLTQLKETGFKLAVATGKTRVGLQRAMQATRTSDLFCATRCADETASKPDPFMLQQILSELETPKHRTLMVGDSIHDLQMAVNAQIASVAVTCGAHDTETLQQYHPLHCLNQTTEILELLKRGNNV